MYVFGNVKTVKYNYSPILNSYISCQSSGSSDSDHGMIVGARQAGLIISLTADLLEFQGKQSLEFPAHNGTTKKKHPMSSNFADRNILLMSEENIE